MHNILSDTEYSRRMLPATPPRRAKSPPSPLRNHDDAGGRAIIDLDPPRRRARSPADAGGAYTGHRSSSSSSSSSRRDALGRPRDGASFFRRGRRDLVRPEARRCWGHACTLAFTLY